MRKLPRINKTCPYCGRVFAPRPSAPGLVCSRRCSLRRALCGVHKYDVFGDPKTAFETRLPKDRTQHECWTWGGAKFPTGYGRFKSNYAHRAAYELYRGPIPKGLTIDHLCCNKICVNPLHLEIVTRSENTRRGHALRKPYQRKLTPAQVSIIRHRYAAESVTQYELGVEFGVSQTHISYVIREGASGSNR